MGVASFVSASERELSFELAVLVLQGPELALQLVPVALSHSKLSLEGVDSRVVGNDLFDHFFDNLGILALFELSDERLEILALESPRGFDLLLGDDDDVHAQGLGGLAILLHLKGLALKSLEGLEASGDLGPADAASSLALDAGLRVFDFVVGLECLLNLVSDDQIQ